MSWTMSHCHSVSPQLFTKVLAFPSSSLSVGVFLLKLWELFVFGLIQMFPWSIVKPALEMQCGIQLTCGRFLRKEQLVSSECRVASHTRPHWRASNVSPAREPEGRWVEKLGADVWISSINQLGSSGPSLFIPFARRLDQNRPFPEGSQSWVLAEKLPLWKTN